MKKLILLSLALLCSAVSALAVEPTVVTAGKAAQFSVTVDGTPPFNYEWQKASSAAPTVFVKIATAPNAPTYTTPKLTNVGTEFYRVVVSNTAGNATSDNASITVNPAKPTIITFGVTIVDASTP